jgi:hypothetical protein
VCEFVADDVVKIVVRTVEGYDDAVLDQLGEAADSFANHVEYDVGLGELPGREIDNERGLSFDVNAEVLRDLDEARGVEVPDLVALSRSFWEAQR